MALSGVAEKLAFDLAALDDYDALADVFFDAVSGVMPLDLLAIYITDIGRRQLKLMTSNRVNDHWSDLYPQIPDIDVLGKLLVTSDPGTIITFDRARALSDERQMTSFDFTEKHTATSRLISMPLVRNRTVFAGLGLYRSEFHQCFTAGEQSSLKSFVPLFISGARALILYREHLSRTAGFDELISGQTTSGILLNENLEIEYCSKESIEKLCSPGGSESRDFLPWMVRIWIERVIEKRAPLDRGPWYFEQVRPSGRLTWEACLTDEGCGHAVELTLHEDHESFSCLRACGLTPRECEVISFLPDGCTNIEIASLLGIGEMTVKKHLRNAAVKLDARGRTEILARALEIRNNVF